MTIQSKTVALSVQLRQTLETTGQALAVPGVYDPLSARRAAHAGFPAVFVSGRSVAQAAFDDKWSYIQAKDSDGYLRYVTHLCAATTVPVIADAEDGFGDTVATCRALERAGAAGVQLQDGIETGGFLTTEEMVRSIEAVRAATDLVVIARSDLLAEDRAEALTRLTAYRAAGADLVMAGITQVAREVYVGSALLEEMAAAAGTGLAVFTPDGQRLLPVYALPAAVRVVLLTAALVDRATTAIDETLRQLADLAGIR